MRTLVNDASGFAPKHYPMLQRDGSGFLVGWQSGAHVGSMSFCYVASLHRWTYVIASHSLADAIAWSFLFTRIPFGSYSPSSRSWLGVVWFGQLVLSLPFSLALLDM